MTTLGLGFGMAGPLVRDSLTGFDTCGSQQQPTDSATVSGVLAGPHPQPDWPSALASASAAQQASTPRRGGTAAASGRGDRAVRHGRFVEHTPVSGSTR